MEAGFGGSSSYKLAGGTKSVDEVIFPSLSVTMEVEENMRTDLLCPGR
jgi:hypothetical protein